MKKYISLILITLFSYSATAAPKAATKKSPLTLKKFISLAIQNNPAFKRISADYKSQRDLSRKTAAIRDILLTATTAFSYIDPVYSGSSISSYNYRKLDLQTSLTKKFPSLLGMTASLNFNYTGVASKNSSGTTSSDYSPSLGISLTIPLLNNFLGIVDKIGLKEMRLNIKVLKKSEQEAKETYIESLYYAYYDWALANQKIAIYQGFMNRALGLYSQTLRKRRIGIADYADVSLTLQNYLSYKLSLQNAQLQAKQHWLKISSLMQGKQTTKKEVAEQTPQLKFDNKIEPIKHNTKQEDLRVLQISRLQVETARILLRSARSSAKPSLNLILNGSKSSGDSALGSSFNNFDRNSLYAGLELSMPLQNTEKKKQLSASIAALKKFQRTHQELLISVNFSLNKLRLTIEQLKQLVKLQAQVAAASATRVNAMYRKYRQGRVALSQVTDARNAWANARISLIEQSISLKKTAISYAALTDQLLK